MREGDGNCMGNWTRKNVWAVNDLDSYRGNIGVRRRKTECSAHEMDQSLDVSFNESFGRNEETDRYPSDEL